MAAVAHSADHALAEPSAALDAILEGGLERPFTVMTRVRDEDFRNIASIIPFTLAQVVTDLHSVAEWFHGFRNLMVELKTRQDRALSEMRASLSGFKDELLEQYIRDKEDALEESRAAQQALIEEDKRARQETFDAFLAEFEKRRDATLASAADAREEELNAVRGDMHAYVSALKHRLTAVEDGAVAARGDAGQLEERVSALTDALAAEVAHSADRNRETKLQLDMRLRKLGASVTDGASWAKRRAAEVDRRVDDAARASRAALEQQWEETQEYVKRSYDKLNTLHTAYTKERTEALARAASARAEVVDKQLDTLSARLQGHVEETGSMNKDFTALERGLNDMRDMTFREVSKMTHLVTTESNSMNKTVRMLEDKVDRWLERNIVPHHVSNARLFALEARMREEEHCRISDYHALNGTLTEVVDCVDLSSKLLSSAAKPTPAKRRRQKQVRPASARPPKSRQMVPQPSKRGSSARRSRPEEESFVSADSSAGSSGRFAAFLTEIGAAPGDGVHAVERSVYSPAHEKRTGEASEERGSEEDAATVAAAAATTAATAAASPATAAPLTPVASRMRPTSAPAARVRPMSATSSGRGGGGGDPRWKLDWTERAAVGVAARALSPQRGRLRPASARPRRTRRQRRALEAVQQRARQRRDSFAADRLTITGKRPGSP